MNIQFDILKTRFKLNFAWYRVRDTWTKGILNKCMDGSGKFIFLADYDFDELEIVDLEMKHLQEIYDLGDIHIFQSSQRGFHCVSFVKLTAKEYMEILINSSVDAAFKNLPRFSTFRNWVIRIDKKGNTPKPIYIKTIKAETKREQSLGHSLFYQEVFPKVAEKFTITNSDGCKKVKWLEYATGGNVG